MLRWLLVAVIAVAAVPAIAFADPPTTKQDVPDVDRPHEIIYEHPSGFWTSNLPAPKGAEYRYRLLGIGAIVAALTGWLTYRLVRNTKRPS